MLDIQEYCSSKSIISGIERFVKDHAVHYSSCSTDLDSIIKMIKNNAKGIMPTNEYDSFRKAISYLLNGKTFTLKRENLFRLCFSLNLQSDIDAQDLFTNYLHQNELSARSLEEFLFIASLKLHLSYIDFIEIRNYFQNDIKNQSLSPQDTNEGLTAVVYYTAMNNIHNKEELIEYLSDWDNLSFFAKTRNTQYLALFSDVELETIYTASDEQLVRLVTDYGSTEKETIYSYYLSLFGLQTPDSDATLSEEEINNLAEKFEGIFMSYDNFCDLVQRKRPVDISSGTFLLNLLKMLITDDNSSDMDFYVDFSDYDNFYGVINDILTYFGFPTLNAECDSFDSLIVDVYDETIAENPVATNIELQRIYLDKLRYYLKEIAYIQ